MTVVATSSTWSQMLEAKTNFSTTWQVQDEDEGPAQPELAPYKSSQRFDSDSGVEDDVEEANELIDEEEDKKYFQTCN